MPRQHRLPSETIYQTVLQQYRTALEQDSFDEGQFPNLSQVMMEQYFLYGRKENTSTAGFYYVFYDIDKNGDEELLIGYDYGRGSKKIADIYGTNQNGPYKLIDEYTLGERSQLHIYPDGRMILVGSGGANHASVTVYRLQENGTLLRGETESYDGEFDMDSVLDNKSGNQMPIGDANGNDASSDHPHFDWQPIRPR